MILEALVAGENYVWVVSEQVHAELGSFALGLCSRLQLCQMNMEIWLATESCCKQFASLCMFFFT